MSTNIPGRNGTELPGVISDTETTDKALEEKKMELIEDAMWLPAPTEQTCQVCGNVYTGIRTNLCEDMTCREWFAAQRQANAHKYGPVRSVPNGSLFYTDLTNNEPEYTKAKTKNEFISRMVEFGKKLLGKGRR